jgi:hypothetical protein
VRIQKPGIELELPAGWTEGRETRPDGSQVVAIGPQRAGMSPNLVITRDRAAAGESIETFARRQIVELKKAIPTLKCSKETSAKIGKHSGFLLEHEMLVQGKKAAQVQFYVLSGTNAVTINYTEFKSSLSQSRKTAEKLIEKIKLSA